MEILPYDIETEDSVLGSVIMYNEEYDKVSKYFINKNVFYQKKAFLLWRKITEMKKNGEPIDTLTVCTSITKEEAKEGLTK